MASSDFGDEFVLAAFDEELGHVEIGRDVNGSLGKHVPHHAGGFPEAAKRKPESMETAVETLDQQRAHDEGELLRDEVGVLVFLFLGRFEEPDGAVTVVGQAVRVRQERNGAVV